MAATKPAPRSSKHPEKKRGEATASLASLTMAAMALPGLLMQPACAQPNDSVSVVYERYQEGERDIGGNSEKMDSKFQPIQVDTILGNVNFTLADDLKGTLTLTQDTWSGATPVATAPWSARGNRYGTGGHTHVTTGASIDDSGHIHDEEDGEVIDPIPQTTSGASPYLYSSLKLDAERRPLITDTEGKVIGGVDNKLVHTLSSASPEVRQQFDLTVSRQMTESTVDVGGGLSQERDFTSLFGHLSGSRDFNRKLTTLTGGISYTHNKTDALLDHDVVPHVYEPYMLTYERRGDDIYNRTFSSSQLMLEEHGPRLKGERDDWAANLGITQILNPTALVEANLSFTRSDGYQANPYKAVEVAFIDPLKQKGQAGGDETANYVYDAELVALLEQRPDLRNQSALSLGYVQYVAATDGALHTKYRYFQDNWGIRAHTLNVEFIQPLGDHWSIAPRLRYYSQTQADFYTPYLITEQGLYSPIAGSDASTPDTKPFDRSLLPAHYSSDARLSGYGTFTAGITLTRVIIEGVDLEFSYEQIQHAGSLKLGGGGEGDYADFDAYRFNLGLNIDLASTRRKTTKLAAMDHSEHSAHHHQQHQHPKAPAGVQFDHLLEKRGDFMVGYRVMAMEQGGAMRGDEKSTNDYTLINKACNGRPCYMRPTDMRMRMHMLDIMYAPSDWLTLMLMPQFVDMTMSMRLLDGSPRTGGMDAIGMAITHAEHPHTTSGVGDTEVHGLFHLYKNDHAELHMGVGLSAPTADVDLQMRPMMGIDLGMMEYGMQLGSGTWDAKPSLTLTGNTPYIAWGAQISGTLRLEDKNESGYALGDILQSTIWGSYSLSDSFSASLRGLYTKQQAITGAYDATHTPISAGDYTQNYGGEFVDLGVGFSANIRTGSFAGTHWGLEWLEPVTDDPNGYQLERKGTLVFNWGVHF